MQTELARATSWAGRESGRLRGSCSGCGAGSQWGCSQFYQEIAGALNLRRCKSRASACGAGVSGASWACGMGGGGSRRNERLGRLRGRGAPRAVGCRSSRGPR
eukprot:scaffold453_cov243-Pinguiococcus_pyrenoidosus.AAC.14